MIERTAVRWLCLMLVWASAMAPAAATVCPPDGERAQRVAAAQASPPAGRRAAWEAAIAAHRACNDAEAEAQALASWSEQTMRDNQRDEALEVETARHALAARAGLEHHRADSALHLGILLANRGEADLGERRLREAASLFESLGAWSQAADTYSRLARGNRQAGDYLAALTDEQTALAMRRRIDPPPNVWRSLLNLAVLYEQLELHEDARRRYADALDEAEREGNDANVAIVLSAFSGYLNDFGAEHTAQALSMAERALTLVRRGGDQVQIASALLQVGRAHMNLRHLDDAEVAYTEGLALAQAADHRAMSAHIIFRSGELALLQGKPALALQRLDDARQRYESLGNRHRLVKVHAALEEVHTALGDPLSAARAGRERFRLRDELLGSSATGRLGELLSRFELSEERLRNEHLQQEKAVAELTLQAERRELQLFYLVTGGIALALLLLGWRHVTARRLYRLLSQQNQLVVAQSEQLAAANRQLTEQSERLYRTSITDALTGVHNRAHGMARLQEWLTPGAERSGCPAVLLFDVDHFKAINDRHGHPVGDQVLVAVAHALQAALPEGAELSRIGGEEFMVLLADSPQQPAIAVAEALRRCVHEICVEACGQRIGVSVSGGLCRAAHLSRCSPQRAYAAADAALYLAKGAGRDRIVVYGDEQAAALP